MSQIKRERGESGTRLRATPAFSHPLWGSGSTHSVYNNAVRLLIHLSAEGGLSLGARVCTRAYR